MDLEELKYYYAFLRTGKVGPVHFEQALKVFGSVRKAWQANPEQYRKLGWGDSVIRALITIQREIDFEKELLSLLSSGVKVVTKEDGVYPERLRQIADPPFLLFVRGEITVEDTLSLAVVGSRKMTAYGRQVTQMLVRDLVLSGITIISGLALGIDAEAHKAALEAGGRTIAVLGSGIDKIHPPSNRSLAEKIITSGQGAIISEFPPGTEAFPSNFPFRNRLISGLGLGVIVTEAAERSGTLITVGHALEQGREVFAVPGQILSGLSKGPHKLIKMGAKLVESADDILEELDFPKVKKGPRIEIIPESPEEEVILKILGEETLHIDEIIRGSGLPTSVASSVITMMEIKGKLIHMGGGNYRKGRG